ncbi:MAG: TonB-dependent receptor [Xanthobacteraceae bacterium]
MPFCGGRIFLLSSAAASALLASGEPAGSQTALPEIVVTTPSPIARRAPARPGPAAPAPVPQAPVEPAPPAITAAPLPGTLPIVTDQFATVTVVPNEEIRRTGGGTLGDLLLDKPGITGSSFAPGASSRPIIRGLDVNRVGIMENGIGSGGASDLGEDHFVPINPLATSQVEVIRGPATLRYGSQSIGGVVNAIDNRIPETLPCREPGPLRAYSQFPAKAIAPSIDPAPCATLETRSAVTTVDNGREGGVLIDAGSGNIAFHADAYSRTADDYRIPRYPYLIPPDPAVHPRATQPDAFNGRQPNSALHFEGGAVGGSYVFDSGFLGVAVIHDAGVYHIPGIDGEDHRTRIDARQTKVLSKGEVRAQSGAVDTIRFWLGATDYKHDELGLADPADPFTDGVRQTFTNKEQEGRIEVTLMPFDLRFAALTTALGVQAGHQDLTAPGDVPGPFSGLFDPNNNNRIAGYMFNELKFTETTKAQLAGRIEHVKLKGTTPDFPADFVPDGTDLVVSARSLNFTPKSASVGVIQNLPWDLAASLTGQYVERAPKPAELFSRGPHDATATFDIGNPNLDIEVAKSLEAGLRRAKGPFRFEATAYVTRFNGFIFRQLTGVLCDETFDTCGSPAAELKQAVYSQRDATFRGGEFQAQLEVAPLWTGVWGVEGQLDVVRATFTDGTNVPRIPPVRAGGGLFWRDGNWLVRVNLLHAFAHNEIEVTPTFVETPTPGYNNLKAEISYRLRVKPTAWGPSDVLVGIVGNNLLNDDIRNSVSYTKDEVLLPGRSVRVFANVKF